MDWPYTDCPTLCTRRALTAEDLESSAPGLVVEADGNGTDFSVSRGGDGDDRDGNILEIGVHTYSLDESLDFFEYVRDVSGRDDLRFCYWVDCETYEDGGWTHGDLALTIVEALARRCDGVIAVWLERVVWPAPEPAPPDFVEPTRSREMVAQSVHMRWFVRKAVCATPVSAWMRAVGRTAPQWLPRAYSGPAWPQPLDEAAIRNADDWWHGVYVGMSLYGDEPMGRVWLGNNSQIAEPCGMYEAQCTIGLDRLNASEMSPLFEVFTAVADELGAELALAEVLTGWSRARDGSFAVGAEEHRPQNLHVGRTILAGLPAHPVPWCYLGPAYSRLLSGSLLQVPASWEQRRTFRGVALRLSPTPVRSEDLPPTWFPPKYCISRRRRWFRAPDIVGAAAAPQWG